MVAINRATSKNLSRLVAARDLFRRWDRVLTAAIGQMQEFYNPDQLRDQGGKFADEGKGSLEPGYQHPDAAELKGLDKRLVDHVHHRPLSRQSGNVVSITHYLPDMHYVMYSKTPFFDKLNKLQGTPDVEHISAQDYKEARHDLFKSQPCKTLPVDSLIATQPVVNKKKVKKVAKESESKALEVVHYGDKYFVMDGHHALAGAVKRGDKKIKAHVLEISNKSIGGDTKPKREATGIKPPTNDSDVPRYVADLKQTTEYKAVAGRLANLASDPMLKDYKTADGRPTTIEEWSLAKNSTATGELTSERQALHEKIANSVLNPKAVAIGSKPQAVILMGRPGSGKTTVGGNEVKKYGEATYLNPDDIRAQLPENEGWNAPATQAEAKQIYAGALKKALTQRHNIVFDETGTNAAKMTARVEALNQAGYDVHVVHVNAPLHATIKRTWERYRRHGRFVDPDYQLNSVDGNPERTYAALKENPNVKSAVSINNTEEKK